MASQRTVLSTILGPSFKPFDIYVHSAFSLVDARRVVGFVSTSNLFDVPFTGTKQIITVCEHEKNRGANAHLSPAELDASM